LGVRSESAGQQYNAGIPEGQNFLRERPQQRTVVVHGFPFEKLSRSLGQSACYRRESSPERAWAQLTRQTDSPSEEGFLIV